MTRKIIEVSLKGKRAMAKSVQKWERIVKDWAEKEPGTYTLGLSPAGCGCCDEYNKNLKAYEFFRCGCGGCPVFLDVEARYCDGTPFDKYKKAPSGAGAVAELEYLKDLDSRCVTVKGLLRNRVKE